MAVADALRCDPSIPSFRPLATMRVWPQHARGAWHLYGHSHGNLPDDPLALPMDVGVDSHDFRPWHFDEIQAVMKAKAAARQQHIQRKEAAAEGSAES